MILQIGDNVVDIKVRKLGKNGTKKDTLLFLAKISVAFDIALVEFQGSKMISNDYAQMVTDINRFLIAQGYWPEGE